VVQWSISSILQREPDFKTLEAEIWEATAAAGRAELTAVLEALDAALMARRPAGLRHCGWKRRIVEGLIGRVEIRRRRYREELATGERRWRDLLDEAVGLPPEVTVSPGLRDRGWERRHPGSAEYRLARKHVYGAVAGAEAFWRGAVLSLHGYCALEQVRWAVLNGDGAGWIRQGIEYLPNCEFRLDRWHLWQAVKTGLSEQPVAQRQVHGVIQGGGEWATGVPPPGAAGGGAGELAPSA